jgi:hypothetical protein
MKIPPTPGKGRKSQLLAWGKKEKGKNEAGKRKRKPKKEKHSRIKKLIESKC